MCSDAPDYGPLADASVESAQIMADLGREQLDFNRDQFETYSPLVQGIANQHIASQGQQMDQGADYYNYLRDTYRPVEQGLVSDAQNFNTEAYRDQMASQAASDSGLAFNLNRQANERAMRSMGADPNSGAGMAMQQQNQLQNSAQRAGLMNNSRQQAQQMGWARRMDAAGLGRNLAGASTAAYGGATNAGNAGVNAALAPTNTFNQGFGMGANTIGQGQQMQLAGLGNVLNAQASYAGQQAAGTGQLIGTAAGFSIASDRRLKENIVKVGEENGYAVYEFNYTGDPRRFRGVMADEVQPYQPDAVVEDEMGYLSVDYDKIKVAFREVV
jgi:hypothetical protein